MPQVLLTQKAMTDRRRSLSHCYVCSSPLPPKTPGWRQRVVGDHVVPRTLLGPPPRSTRDAWAVELFIHKECEERHKRARDQLAKVVQAIATGDRDSWDPSDVAMLAKSIRAETYERPGDVPVYAFSGIENVILAANLWSRGMHAALYGQVPPATLGHVTQAPVPVWSDRTETPDDGLMGYEQRRDWILRPIRVAIHTRTADRVCAWGGQLTYECTWRPALIKRSGPWCCVWALGFPGVSHWAVSVRGVDTPWHGYYETQDLPKGASVLQQEDIDRYNRFVGLVRNGLTVTHAGRLSSIAGTPWSLG